ncbi:hypothetical protein OBBRIDRAFT_507514 [Obba rivulosa]|uniref:Uncharacterized protein n=1 Tax=Obba rivulosa TaxID=1052685 RepID=A0A8E2DEB8_9APHY|nr:hypothetical protein OBBRIDRAFT_507514 [Obba rivulosa]
MFGWTWLWSHKAPGMSPRNDAEPPSFSIRQRPRAQIVSSLHCLEADAHRPASLLARPSLTGACVMFGFLSAT